MPAKIDMEKIIADNPSVDPEGLRKAEEALRSLHQTGVVRRSTYGLETPESRKEIRHSDDVTANAPHIRRLG